MLDILNGLDEVAWAGIAAMVAAVFAGIGAAWKGSKRHPAEVGSTAPPTDVQPMLLTEIREMSRLQADWRRAADGRFEDLERDHEEHMRLLGRIYTDTQVLRERGSR